MGAAVSRVCNRPRVRAPISRTFENEEHADGLAAFLHQHCVRPKRLFFAAIEERAAGLHRVRDAEGTGAQAHVQQRDDDI